MDQFRLLICEWLLTLILYILPKKQISWNLISIIGEYAREELIHKRS